MIIFFSPSSSNRLVWKNPNNGSGAPQLVLARFYQVSWLVPNFFVGALLKKCEAVESFFRGFRSKQPKWGGEVNVSRALPVYVTGNRWSATARTTHRVAQEPDDGRPCRNGVCFPHFPDVRALETRPIADLAQQSPLWTGDGCSASAVRLRSRLGKTD